MNSVHSFSDGRVKVQGNMMCQGNRGACPGVAPEWGWGAVAPSSGSVSRGIFGGKLC